MPMNSKWILTLGILAMSPGVAAAQSPFSLPGLSGSGKAAAAKSNQDVANEIAAALRQARLVGYDINIEYKEGVAVLSGMIQDANQKALAEKLTASVAEVSKVDNRLGLINPPAGQAVQQTAFQSPVQPAAGVQNAAYEANAAAPIASPIQQTAGTQPSATKVKNQQTAQNIAQALKQSGLAGYDISINFKDGVAGLSGSVATPQQKQLVSQVTSQVPGVGSVKNDLQVKQPVSPAAFQPALEAPMPPAPAAPMPPMPPTGPGMMAPGMMPPGMMYPPSAMGAPPVMGHAGPGPVSPVYNQPYLPDYAWPTTAPYPNSAAISYPTQYSASAFPYIGPFYPYPQVPLGWRSSTLEWDDGQWQLKFSPKTDRWWWFFNPKNWD